ncbi:MAG: hypothetical protein QOF51_1985 [Chloroflexota bacterium]|nr:hypothetical protein [Chloroflexota bacterium]
MEQRGIDGPSIRISIVGAGRTGTVLGMALARAGYHVATVASRSPSSAKRLAARLPTCRVARSAAGAAEDADVVFLTVPDDAIVAVAESIPWKPGQLAVHCAGARPAGILVAATRAGAGAAGFHPLQSLVEPEVALDLLPGSAIGIEADDRWWEILATMAQRIGATPLRIQGDNRELYHAASVAASNFVVGLMAFAADLWRDVGIDREATIQALLPLMLGSIRNLQTIGLPNALTGPVSRGDVGTVRAHIGALQADPARLDIYRALSRVLVGLAKEQGTITEPQATALRDVLGESGAATSAPEENASANERPPDSGDGPPR